MVYRLASVAFIEAVEVKMERRREPGSIPGNGIAFFSPVSWIDFFFEGFLDRSGEVFGVGVRRDEMFVL
jgi:hypothetical protein